MAGTNRRTVLTSTASDVRALPIGAREAFFLSQLDGRLTVEDVAEITGLTLEEAVTIATHLVELGAASEHGSGGRPSRGPRRSRHPRAQTSARPPAIDPVEVERILALDARLGTIDHYTLLELARDADKRAIRSAYVRCTAAFHPDHYFGKDLEPVRRPLERLLRRVIEAHDTLRDPARRAAYDATLPEEEEPAPSVEAPPRAIEPAPPAPRAVAPSPPPGPAPLPHPDSSSRTLTSEQIRRLREAATEARTQASIALLVKAAEDALIADDFIAAANNYRLALAHGEDAALRRKYELVEARAREVKAERQRARARAVAPEEEDTRDPETSGTA